MCGTALECCATLAFTWRTGHSQAANPRHERYIVSGPYMSGESRSSITLQAKIVYDRIRYITRLFLNSDAFDFEKL